MAWRQGSTPPMSLSRVVGRSAAWNCDASPAPGGASRLTPSRLVRDSAQLARDNGSKVGKAA